MPTLLNKPQANHISPVPITPKDALFEYECGICYFYEPVNDMQPLFASTWPSVKIIPRQKAIAHGE